MNIFEFFSGEVNHPESQITKRENKETYLERLKSGIVDEKSDIPKDLLNDKDFVIKAIKINWRIFKIATKDIRDDKEVALVAVHRNPELFERLSRDLQKDPDIISNTKEAWEIRCRANEEDNL